MSIEPRNITAQIQHRAAGNPPSTMPDAAISNCFPGLEFDARNIWRRIFVGIEVHEADGVVVAVDDGFEALLNREIQRVGGVQVRQRAHGPTAAAADAVLPRGLFTLEWSNALADAVAAGGTVEVEFVGVGGQPGEVVELEVRPVFARSPDGETLPTISEEILAPGELTQSLCSPWQNDYRECGCYYWAASRPDYVNVQSTPDGSTTGTNWMARDRAPTGYTPDIPGTPSQFSYDDLFRNWQGLLPFVVDGRDHD